MADIRRDVGDVSPNTFVQQGVQDNSLATALGGVGSVAMDIDASLARKRLDDAQQMLQAQYVVGSPAANTLTEESDTDKTPLSPEDSRALKDFSDVLNTQKAAVDQGRMNHDSYQLRAERLTRIAIRRRPGLAQDFREIASRHTGSYEVQFLKEGEEALAKAGAAAAKNQYEERKHQFELQQKQLIDSGFAGALNFSGPDDAGWAEYYQTVFPAYAKKSMADSAANLAKQQHELAGITKEHNRTSNTDLWTANAEQIIATTSPAVEQIWTSLKQQGLDKDPSAIRTAISRVKEQLDERIRQLRVGGADGTVAPEVYTQYMERFNKLGSQVETLLSGVSDKELVENGVSLTKALATQSLYNNSDYARYSVVLNDLPDAVAAQVTNTMGKTSLSIVSDVLRETGSPQEQATNGAAVVRDWVIAALPDGSATPPDPVALGKMADTFNGIGTAFLTQPEGSWRAEQFTANPMTGKAGFVKELKTYLPQLSKTLPKERKDSLGAVIMAATGHQTRLLTADLFAKAPALRGKVEARYGDPSGNLLFLKDGQQASPEDQTKLRAANRAANMPMIMEVLQGLTGLKGSALNQQILASYGPGQEAAKAASAARAKTAARATQPQASVARGAPAVGSVDGGFRFKGGDPSDPSNWEPVGE